MPGEPKMITSEDLSSNDFYRPGLIKGNEGDLVDENVEKANEDNSENEKREEIRRRIVEIAGPPGKLRTAEDYFKEGEAKEAEDEKNNPESSVEEEVGVRIEKTTEELVEEMFQLSDDDPDFENKRLEIIKQINERHAQDREDEVSGVIEEAKNRLAVLKENMTQVENEEEARALVREFMSLFDSVVDSGVKDDRVSQVRDEINANVMASLDKLGEIKIRNRISKQ